MPERFEILERTRRAKVNNRFHVVVFNILKRESTLFLFCFIRFFHEIIFINKFVRCFLSFLLSPSLYVTMRHKKAFFGKFESFSHAVSTADEKGISQFSLTLIIAL